MKTIQSSAIFGMESAFGSKPTIKLSFILPRHTKFARDRFLDVIKRLYYQTGVSTLADLEQVIKNPTIGDQNLPYCTVKSGECYNVHVCGMTGLHISVKCFVLFLAFYNITISDFMSLT